MTMSYMAMKEFLQEQDRRAETQTIEKKYTIEEIAQKICDSYKYCTEKCPGFEYCRHDKKGVLEWLQTILKSEPNT
jgi:hypothetical protein